MLSAREFGVGLIGGASSGSLVLPRHEYEAVAIIGVLDGSTAAVFLSGNFQFLYFKCAGNQNWGGLIIPNTRIEVDETSVCDPDRNGLPLGSLVRSDTRLVIQAKAENSYWGSVPIILEDNLTPAGDLRAAFTKWQVVIGEGADKRVLWKSVGVV